MVIPRFIQQVQAGEPLTVFGDGEQTRCFLHVSDAVAAMMALAECDEALGQVFNVGSTEEISIYHLAKLVLEKMVEFSSISDQIDPKKGREYNKARIKFIPYEDAYAVGFEDMARRVPDTSKIFRFTGWETTKNLEDTLRDMIQ